METDFWRYHRAPSQPLHLARFEPARSSSASFQLLAEGAELRVLVQRVCSDGRSSRSIHSRTVEREHQISFVEPQAFSNADRIGSLFQAARRRTSPATPAEHICRHAGFEWHKHSPKQG